MSNIYTNGKTLRLTGVQLEAADTISVSARDLKGSVSLATSTPGFLDLSDELQNRGVTFSGSSGDDTLILGSGNDTVLGGAGDDTIWATGGDDKLFGGVGDDVFIYGIDSAGTDEINGGAGTDRVIFGTDYRFESLILNRASSVEILELQDDLLGTNRRDVFDLSGILRFERASTSYVIALAGGNDQYVGMQAADDVYGEAGNDTIKGGLGDDTINGGVGNDKLDGGAGDDWFVINSAAPGRDRLKGGGGTDTLFIDGPAVIGGIAALTVMRKNSVETLEIRDDVFGTNGADQFNLSGILKFDRASTSYVIALAGGNDLYVGMQAADDVYGQAGNDTIKGGLGDDAINGGTGDDKLFGGDGDDTFVIDEAAPGSDRFQGGDGTDVLYVDGSSIAGGINKLTVGLADSVETLEIQDDVLGTSGADQFDLSGILTFARASTSYVIALSGGNDFYIGMQAADDVYGQAGNDTIKGGLGDDLINGGTGDDSLDGGDGDDTFTIDEAAPGSDRFQGGDGTDVLYVDGSSIAGGINKLTVGLADSVETLEIQDDVLGTSGADQFDLSGILTFARASTSYVIALAGGNDQLAGGK